MPRRVAIGESVDLTFDLVSTARGKQSLLVDYRVHFVKADGSTRPKVFKLTTLDLEAGEAQRLKTRISLRQMTTRKHYPGEHVVDVVVNGAVLPAGSFVIR